MNVIRTYMPLQNLTLFLPRQFVEYFSKVTTEPAEHQFSSVFRYPDYVIFTFPLTMA